MNYTSCFVLTTLLAFTLGCASNKDNQTKLNSPDNPTETDEKLVADDLSPPKSFERIEQAFDLDTQVKAQAQVEAQEMLPIEPSGPEIGRVGAIKLRKVKEHTAYLAGQSSVMLAEHMSVDSHVPYYQPLDQEQYAVVEQGAIKQVIENPVSTFSVDVDTGSYTNIRRMLRQGSLPPVNAVRVEEMINYFNYDYKTPSNSSVPFSIYTELADSPWSESHALLKIGLKGYQPPAMERPNSNLVFLLDVSGSMNAPNKLPLLKKSLSLLSKQLTENDSVAIVVYAGASGVALEPTKATDTHKIEQALNTLAAGGSTNGQAGIQLAYQLAKQNYDTDGINRVILATDGDFNVGTSDVESLKKLIEEKRKQGISLTTLGFGSGNYNDELMETLADVGNGNYAYIDTFSEAKKVLGEELNATLTTIAKDVKIQIEFNPRIVKEYRLLGYENRALAREDFNNDKVDAGEIGAGHTVTGIYEVALHSSGVSRVDPLRYQSEVPDHAPSESSALNELAFVKFRYKMPKAESSKLLSQPIALPDTIARFEDASESFRFAAVVAQFGDALRQSKYVESDYKAIIDKAIRAKGEDAFGYRSEFIQLVRLAADLSNNS